MNRGGKNDEKNARYTLLSIEIVKFLYQCEGSKLTFVTMENVVGMLDGPNGNINYFNTFASSLIGLGMDVMVSVLDSSR